MNEIKELVNKSFKAGDWIKIEGNGWWASPFSNIWDIDGKAWAKTVKPSGRRRRPIDGKVVNVNDYGINLQFEGILEDEIELCVWNEIDAIYDVDGVVWERE